MIKNKEEFIEFCKDHTMNEIMEVYGYAGKNKIYRSNPKIVYKKPPKRHGEQAINILNDIKNGMKQNDIAKKYGVSRQYISKLKLMEMNDDKLCK